MSRIKIPWRPAAPKTDPLIDSLMSGVPLENWRQSIMEKSRTDSGEKSRVIDFPLPIHKDPAPLLD